MDSPVALAAWMLDHDTDAYYKISRAFVDGEPAGNLTRDHILDNVTLYWLTGTGASAARSYWENGQAQAAAAAGQAPPDVSLPVGFTTFPGEIFRAPRSWVEQGYPTLTYFNKANKGGHFARLGGAGALRRRGPGRVQVTPLGLAKEILMSSTVQQVPGIKRTDLQRHDLSAPGREVIQNRVEIGPDAPLFKHFHPGEEIICVLEGELEYEIEGEPPRRVKAGEALMVPAEAVHAVKNVGDGDAAELATYVVERASRSSRSSTESGVSLWGRSCLGRVPAARLRPAPGYRFAREAAAGSGCCSAWRALASLAEPRQVVHESSVFHDGGCNHDLDLAAHAATSLSFVRSPRSTSRTRRNWDSSQKS